MKKIKSSLFLVMALFLANNAFTQSLNWASLKPASRHLANVNAGWDYAFVFGGGYGYQLNTKMPVVLKFDLAIPAGENVFNDYKTKVGGEIRIYQYKNFHFSANIYGVYRKYSNPLVRMLNFGSEFSAVAGYYKPKWFAAGEFGFDKAVVTHFKHSDSFREHIYNGVKDGWYEPSTGGNFHYGLHGGYSLKQGDITLSVGKTVSQDFKTKPMVPYYVRLGYTMKINSGKKS